MNRPDTFRERFFGAVCVHLNSNFPFKLRVRSAWKFIQMRTRDENIRPMSKSWSNLQSFSWGWQLDQSTVSAPLTLCPINFFFSRTWKFMLVKQKKKLFSVSRDNLSKWAWMCKSIYPLKVEILAEQTWTLNFVVAHTRPHHTSSILAQEHPEHEHESTHYSPPHTLFCSAI